MKSLQFIKNAAGITGNLTSHNGRYINFDGTPYGSTGIARAMLSPGLSLNALFIGAILSPALAIGSLEFYATTVVLAMPVVVASDFVQRAVVNKWVKGDNNWVIDRKGERGDFNAAHVSAKRYIAHRLGSVFCLALGPFGICLHNYHFLSGIASSKLHHGEWTVMTEPPEPRAWKKATKKQRSGKLQPAFG